MASIREVMAAGTAWPLARMIGQNRLRLVAAAGAAQEDAAALTVNYATIATTGPGQGVRLGYAVGAAWNALLNLGPDPVLVYPAEGESINDLDPDLPLAVPPGNLLLALPSVDHWLALSAPGDAGAIADAPGDGMLYGRLAGAWSPVPPPGIGDAPGDGQLYGRAGGLWVLVPLEPLGPDAPFDGLVYGRSMGGWTASPAEAPEDGALYARQNGGWALVPPPGSPAAAMTVAAGPSAAVPAGTGRVYVTTTDFVTLTLPPNDCLVLDRAGDRSNPVMAAAPAGASINGMAQYALVNPWQTAMFLWDGASFAVL